MEIQFNNINGNYNKKLKMFDFKRINFHSMIIRLAKTLFYKLTSFDSFNRYNANQSLNHPWITR